jgi:hypothetical protein
VVSPDAVTASASGLDPAISPAYARPQAPRFARERGVDVGMSAVDCQARCVSAVLGEARPDAGQYDRHEEPTGDPGDEVPAAQAALAGRDRTVDRLRVDVCQLDERLVVGVERRVGVARAMLLQKRIASCRSPEAFNSRMWRSSRWYAWYAASVASAALDASSVVRSRSPS